MFAGAAGSLRSGQFRFNPISARNGGHESLSSAVRGQYWQALCLSLRSAGCLLTLNKNGDVRRDLGGMKLQFNRRGAKTCRKLRKSLVRVGSSSFAIMCVVYEEDV